MLVVVLFLFLSINTRRILARSPARWRSAGLPWQRRRSNREEGFKNGGNWMSGALEECLDLETIWEIPILIPFLYKR